MAPPARWLWLLVLPAITFLLVVFVLPIALLVGSSFYQNDILTITSYWQFMNDPVAHRAFLRTVRIGLLVTFIAILFCYPAAYAISRVGARWRALMIAVMILPLMTNPVARTFAWLVILGQEGLINNSLRTVGMESVRILYTEPAVVLGLLHLFIPLMMLPLISAFENVPKDVVLAARSLGASEFDVFRKVLIPLTAEGLGIGVALVFTGCVTAYVTPAILGGSRNLMLSTLLYQKASVTLDWPGATAVAAIMFLTTLLAIFLIRRFARIAASGSIAGAA